MSEIQQYNEDTRPLFFRCMVRLLHVITLIFQLIKHSIMKKKFMGKIAFATAAAMIVSSMAQTSFAQEYTYYYEIEKLQQENMEYLETINEIISDYPAFSYDYTYEEGKLKNVTVKGVESDLDRKRLEVVIFDLKSNRNMMKTDQNRVGVFYSPESPAIPKNGEEKLREQIQNNLSYPEAPENWGVEGTVLVSFVVDENGEIPFISANTNIETTQEFLIKDLRFFRTSLKKNRLAG